MSTRSVSSKPRSFRKHGIVSDNWKSVRDQLLAMAASAEVLRPGDLGTIVEVHGDSGLEVEFVTASGRNSVVVTLDVADVRPVDGRTVAVPVAWYPRLAHGLPEERENWRLVGRGEGIR